MSNLKINKQANIRQDGCAINLLNKNNTMVADYAFPPYLSDIDPSRNSYLDSFSQPALFQTGNFGGYPSHVDDDSQILNGKIGNIVTHGREKRIFKTGSYLTPPYMGPKTMALKPDEMSRLITGEQTRDRESLRGKTIDRFVPLLPEIQREIQNPKHIVPKFWVNGGMDTRVVIRNVDYLKACGLKK